MDFDLAEYWLAATVSMLSLPRYYELPKQAFRSPPEYVKELRRPGDVVIVVHLAEAGYHCYGRRQGIRKLKAETKPGR